MMSVLLVKDKNMNLYDYTTVKEVEIAMDTLHKVDREMFSNFTVKEIIDDAVTAGLMPVATGNAYMVAYVKGEVCQY